MSDTINCPWCDAEESTDDVKPSDRRCDSCERIYQLDIDYDPAYYTSKIACHACEAEIERTGLWTKLGRFTCCETCRDACNAAYDRREYPKRGFLSETEGRASEVER